MVRHSMSLRRGLPSGRQRLGGRGREPQHARDRFGKLRPNLVPEGAVLAADRMIRKVQRDEPVKQSRKGLLVVAAVAVALVVLATLWLRKPAVNPPLVVPFTVPTPTPKADALPVSAPPPETKPEAKVEVSPKHTVSKKAKHTTTRKSGALDDFLPP